MADQREEEHQVRGFSALAGNGPATERIRLLAIGSIQWGWMFLSLCSFAATPSGSLIARSDTAWLISLVGSIVVLGLIASLARPVAHVA